MAVQCPPPYSVLEGTNGNYETLRTRLVSRGSFGSGFCSESSVEPQTRDPDLKKLPFFNGMDKVIQELDGVEKVCIMVIEKMLEDAKSPDGPGSSQSDVSQGSIENTAMKNASSLAMGAEKLSERKRVKFSPPVEGIIDLTSEDSCDSRTSTRLAQDPADAGQVQSSPLGTSVATSIEFLSSDDEDDNANDGENDDDEEEENVNAKGSQSFDDAVEDANVLSGHEEEDVNAKGSLSVHAELAKPGVKADSNDPLAETWYRMGYEIEMNKRANQGVRKEPFLAKGFIPPKDKDNGGKRRKVNNGDVSQTIRSDDVSLNMRRDLPNGSSYCQWANDEPSEVVQVVEPTFVVKPKRGRGRPRKEVPAAPRKEAPVQVECRDLLEVVEYGYGTQKPEVEAMVVDLKPNKGKKTAEEKQKEDRRNNDVQREKKERKKRQNSEERMEEVDSDEEEEEECAKSGLEDPGTELNKRTLLLKDEKVDYEPYVRSKYQKEAEEGDLDDIFFQAKSAQASSVAPPAVSEEECLHPNFDFEEAFGYYCDDCGAINIEMPTRVKKCRHLNYEYKDDAGIFCPDCGKVIRDIERLFVAMEIDKAQRKQTQKVQEKGDGSPHVQLLRQGASSAPEFSGVDLQLHPLFEEKMHSHQKKGFKFLTEHLLQGSKGSKEPMGCVLAHAPGTGKTCLVISFIQSFLTKFPEGKPLILAPKGIVPNWESEFEIWKVQEFPIYRIGGGGGSCYSPGTPGDGEDDDEEEEDARLVGSQGMSIKESRAKTLAEWKTGRGGVLLMSYNMFQILVANGLGENVHPDCLDHQISKVLLEAPNLVILDEGHLARNNKTQISQALHRMETKRKVILSGTLFQNNFKELYNLMKLCRDDFMISHPLYQKRITDLAFNINGSSTKYNNGSASLQKKSMKELMVIEEKIFTEEIGEKLEMYVRSGETRTAEIEPVVMKLQALTPFVDWYPGEILKSLPGLFEYSLHLQLTTSQMHTIARIPNSNYMSKQCMLSGACIHPSLTDKSEDSTADFLRASDKEKEPHKGVKITFIMQLMAKCMAAGERVLIFCSTLSPLRYLEELFTRQFKWQLRAQILRLDGSMAEWERQKTIAQFNDFKSQSQVLLASTKACKEGISLVGASRVVILDTTDNPSVVRQAVSRAFRIGQKRKVYVYRLVAEHKDENLIFNRSVNKERLSNVLLDPVATMARLRGFLQADQGPADVEDKFLKEIMMNDRTRVDDERYIREVQKYNALS